MKVISVFEFNSSIKELLKSKFGYKYVYVKGEISNFKSYQSGHFYFSLKDSKAVVKCVMYSSYAKKLKFNLKDGMEVLLKSTVDLYEVKGDYQLKVEDVYEVGLGGLNLAYEQLKQKLFEEGLFDEQLKRPIPKYPHRIGIITSPTGAVIRDMLKNIERRWPIAEIVFCPCVVQGEYSENSLLNALDMVESQKNIDVIIIGRGGGSIEELWSFNSEKLARRISKCKIPVISAVGHETDFTICDFVSDLRVSVPGVAAEVVVPDKNEELAKLNAITSRLNYLEQKKFNDFKIILERYDNIEDIATKNLKLKYNKLNNLKRELMLCGENNIQKSKLSFLGLSHKLDALSPLKVISRGYSILQSEEKVIVSIDQVQKDQEIKAVLKDGKVKLKVIDLEKN